MNESLYVTWTITWTISLPTLMLIAQPILQHRMDKHTDKLTDVSETDSYMHVITISRQGYRRSGYKIIMFYSRDRLRTAIMINIK